MFNIFHSLGPSYLQQFFTKISDVYSHSTRSSAWNFQIPRVGSHTKKSFFYQATLDWNNLPSNIKSILDKCIYESAMKKHLARCAMTHESAEYVQLISFVSFVHVLSSIPGAVLFFLWGPIGNKFTHTCRLYRHSWHLGIMASTCFHVLSVYVILLSL